MPPIVHCTACALTACSRRACVLNDVSPFRLLPTSRDGLMLASTEKSTASVDQVGGQVDDPAYRQLDGRHLTTALVDSTSEPVHARAADRRPIGLALLAEGAKACAGNGKRKRE